MSTRRSGGGARRPRTLQVSYDFDSEFIAKPGLYSAAVPRREYIASDADNEDEGGDE